MKLDAQVKVEKMDEYEIEDLKQAISLLYQERSSESILEYRHHLHRYRLGIAMDFCSAAIVSG
jgi:hypothetical protein